MHRTSTFLSATQREWPILPRLSLIVCTAPPAWAIASAHTLSSRFSAAERVRCRAACPQQIAQLSALRRRWWGTLLLAALLAMALTARLFEVSLDVQHMIVFAVTFYAILLPALLIHIGITYDYIAASALLQALRSTAVPHSPGQPASANLAPDQAFVIAAPPSAQLQPEYVEHEVEQREPLND